MQIWARANGLALCGLAVMMLWATPLPAQDAADKLVIVKAVYGDLAGTTGDVTKEVTALVKDNALSVEATNENFGDPVQGTVKKMRIDYTVGGVAGSKIVNEHELITLVAGEKPPVIVKARWGNLDAADGKSIDITEKIAAMVKAGEVSILASKEKLGDSGAVENRKLRVEYTINGKPHGKIVEENVYLIVGPVVAQSGDLIIKRARYGSTGSPAIDATDLVAAKVKNGVLTMDVTDAYLGNMGAPEDSGKTLEVMYTLKGVEGTKKVYQDEPLIIGGTAPATQPR